MESRLSVKPYEIKVGNALSMLNTNKVWNFKDEGEKYDAPLKVVEYDPSMFKECNEVRGTFGAYQFRSECGNYGAVTENGIRGVGYEAVAVLFEGGVLVMLKKNIL